jgi:hypothetical protein
VIRACGSSARRSSAGADRRAVRDRGGGRRARQRHDLRAGRRGVDRGCGRAQRVAGRLRHGTVWINDYNVYLPQAEWGGFKQSGSAASSARPASTSTARPSTSGRTRGRRRRLVRRLNGSGPIFVAGLGPPVGGHGDGPRARRRIGHAERRCRRSSRATGVKAG